MEVTSLIRTSAEVKHPNSIAIKQFIKLNDSWFERYVNIENKNKAFFFDKKINMKNFEKKIHYQISNRQKFIEYSKRTRRWI